MTKEQNKDKSMQSIISKLKLNHKAKELKKFILIDDILYYIEHPDTDAKLRLYVPQHLQKSILINYHNETGAHLGYDKTYDNIREKYYFPNLYKIITEYIQSCLTCQKNSQKIIKPPLVETDIATFPMSKVAVDLSGPYPETVSGNKYLISFICMYSGWIESFPVKNKSAENISHLIINEIIPRYSCFSVLVSGNGGENVNKIVRETLNTLNIKHIKTSFYAPNSNGKIERSHRTLLSVLTKLLNDNVRDWDLHLNSALAAIRFSVNETTKFSPFFLLYNRDPIFPLDNVLKT